ncbi:MAG: DHH family phosphoesterase [archaeon GB-1867-005]|nr:DHH family phosphoesterase [Candidatus Culexmicrobium cathedralense]
MENERVKKLFDDFKCAAETLKEKAVEKVHIIYHDDADGVTAAAILKASLERRQIQVKMICIEKLYPEIIEKLHSEKGKVYIYADIGAPHADRISSVNKGRNLTIILDHHDTLLSSDPAVINLDPELYGISGEEEASGATVCYLFSKILSERNVDLAHLAVIGSSEIPGPVRGLNLIALEDALKVGTIQVKQVNEEKKYLVTAYGRPEPREKIASKLTAMAAIGYYIGGPKRAVNACLSGFSERDLQFIKELDQQRRKVNRQLIAKLKHSGIRQARFVQWFHAYDAYKGMGVKTIGTFCSYLSFQKWINQGKYLIGFMYMSRVIPELGELSRDYVKFSARVPKQLALAIRDGRMPPISTALSEAAKVFGGFADGHDVAASGVIPRGFEKEFIKKLDEIISRCAASSSPFKPKVQRYS